ncbi:MAG: cobalamin-dependent protein [Planctomycetes bacterium]|nr:cobalamin-dependent protein [Planctomycetota bacterium]
MKVALVHPPLQNLLSAAVPEYVESNRGATPPMGLLYIQAAIENSQHESVLFDGALENWDHEETAKKIVEFAPEVVGIQAMTFTLVDSIFVAKEIKKLNPNIAIVIGGPHPTIYPKETAELENVDYAFAGEGEERFIQFLDSFHQTEELRKIVGIAEKGRTHEYEPFGKFLKDMDKIPFPARKSSQWKRYSSVLAKRNPITIMISSRGCPYKCVFCNRMGRQYRFHSAEYVLKEFDEIVKLGIKEVFIHDDTFSIKRSRIVELCNGLLERNYDIIWEARTRVDCVDEDLLKLMKKAGCERLSFGVESGSEKVLKKIQKGTEDLDLVRNTFKYCRQVGITTLADFMVGNLDEEEQDIEDSIRFMKEINPDFVQFSICSPYPGTPLYEMGLKNGMFKKDIWLEFAKNPTPDFKSPVWTQNFSTEELIAFSAKGYKTFYLRPAFIWKQLREIHSLKQFITLAKGAIGMILQKTKR